MSGSVLIVDASRTVRMDLARRLGEAGLTVAEVSTAAAALEAIDQDTFALVICDPYLPDDGWAFVRHILGDEAGSRPPVLLFSNPSSLAEHALALGSFDRLIAKPYVAEEVVNEGRAAIQASESAALPTPDVVVGKRILAVDDSRTHLHRLADELSTVGYEIVLANSGVEALALLHQEPIDCILLDLMMPGLSGRDVCERIKASKEWRDIPVIVLTAIEDDDALVDGIEFGADDFVAKSGNMGVLKARIRSQLRRREYEEENLRVRDEARTAEAATQAKSMFLSNMSHELRTPLNAILGFSELLVEQESVSERGSRYLTNILNAGNHLLDLINDVLDLARVESGRADLRVETISLAALLSTVIESTRVAAENKGVQFEADAPSGQVTLDAGRVRQILFNLLSNAVKFTPAGGTVRLTVHTAGGDLEVEVSDSGMGIPADRQDQVFGMFARVNEDRARIEGTGLGLALTKTLVELHHGEIDFTSEENVGTTFRVRLPQVVQTEASKHVLIVEDDRGSAELLAALIHEAGFGWEIVTTAQGALSAVEARPPAAVILDLLLPDLRGEHVLQELKSHPATAHLPILVVSVEEDIGVARELGADEQLTKPLNKQAALDWLSRVVNA